MVCNNKRRYSLAVVATRPFLLPSHSHHSCLAVCVCGVFVCLSRAAWCCVFLCLVLCFYLCVCVCVCVRCSLPLLALAHKLSFCSIIFHSVSIDASLLTQPYPGTSITTSTTPSTSSLSTSATPSTRPEVWTSSPLLAAEAFVGHAVGMIALLPSLETDLSCFMKADTSSPVTSDAFSAAVSQRERAGASAPRP